MIFITVLLVYLFVQILGSAAQLHHDRWFKVWCARLKNIALLNNKPGALLAAAISGPAVVVLIIFYVLTSIWSWLGLLVAVPVVLYSLGRGNYRSVVDEYLSACDQDDWESAQENYQLLAPNDELCPVCEGKNWAQLHRSMLTAVSYRGFERLFVVLFWFILLGPAGALVYRLSALFIVHKVDEDEVAIARKWLWLIEWPAARVLGLSLAFTGNFVGCFQAWTQCLLCRVRSTPNVLTHYVRGALGLEASDLEASKVEVSDATLAGSEVTNLKESGIGGSESLSGVLTHRELRSTVSLFYRTWIFWMCLLAVMVLVF